MTKYIKEKDIDKTTMTEIVNAIRKGKIVVFRTDTVYGMGTNALNKNAVKKIYEIKERPMYKPLIVLISDINMLNELVDSISITEKKLIDAFWPGSLTIKFKKKENALPDIVSAGDEYIRIRLLENDFAYHLVKKAKIPIVAPSANLSGSFTGTKIENIINELGEKVDYIIDSGNIESDIPSTIVEVNNENIIIIREGKITKEEIVKVLQK